MIRRQQTSTLFPYTTLFRSACCEKRRQGTQEKKLRSLAGSGKPHIETARDRSFFSCRSEEHTSELQSRRDLVCRLLLEKKKIKIKNLLAEHYINYAEKTSYI